MEIKCPVTEEVIRTPVMSRTGSESKYLTEFEDQSFLGAGAFGIVKKCRNLLDNGVYAIKIISLRSANMPFNKILREVRTLCGLQHPHIVRYHQTWLEENFSGVSCSSTDKSFSSENSVENFDFDSPCLYILMEFCPRSLEKFLETSGNLDKEKAWRIFGQIVDGLVEVHAAGIIHRDLSPANILLDAQDNVRISDFGLAKLVNGVNDEAGTGSIGHKLYNAPEVSNKQIQVDTKADIYSLGLIFVELFHNISTDYERVKVFGDLREKKEFPKSWKYEEHKVFVQQLLCTNPGERPTASGILQQQSQSRGSSISEGESEGPELVTYESGSEAPDDIEGVEDEKLDV